MPEQLALNREAPRISSLFRNQPEEVSSSIWQCQNSMSEMDSYCKQFWDVLNLYEFSKLESRRLNSKIVSDWQFIAARDGAMSIFHFAKALDGANTWAAKSGVIHGLWNREKAKEAFRILSNAFPKYEAVRNAVAHAAEVTKSPEQIEKHAFSGSYEKHGFKFEEVKNVTIKNSISNDTFVATFNSEIQEYFIGEETLVQLLMVRDAYFDAFNPIVKEPA